MPLASLKQLLADAESGGYAVCYCESWNLESLQAVNRSCGGCNLLSSRGSMAAS